MKARGIKHQTGSPVRFDEIKLTLTVESVADVKKLRKLLPLLSGRVCEMGTVYFADPGLNNPTKAEIILRKY